MEARGSEETQSSGMEAKTEGREATSSAPPTAAPAHRASHDHHQPATSNLTSTASVNTFASTQSKKEYLESLSVPSEVELKRIATIQADREAEHRRRSREEQRRSREQSRDSFNPQSSHHHASFSQRLEKAAAAGEHEANPSLDDLLRAKAASLIQRTYRGYRARREMKGLAVHASTRWLNAIREAQFREAIRPRARENPEGGLQPLSDGDGGGPGNDRHAIARSNWKKLAIIARRAAIGEEEDEEEEEDVDDGDGDGDQNESGSVHSELGDGEAHKSAQQRRHEVKSESRQEAKMMGLAYFLEMVDLKHRYGSNLRRYHDVWKKSDTNENFFYWLDFGDGRFVEVDSVSRERLEREQVRYLSRDERLDYLVKIDQEGRLCWAKNGARIDTTEQWKDSIHGIVPLDDTTPQFHGVSDHPVDARTSTEDTSGPESEHPRDSSEEEHKHDDVGKGKDLADATHHMHKIHQFSMSKITDIFMRRSVQKNTWIFVADTSFRLYVGIKASGAFQHSSFLQGSRIAAAGLIKIKNGRISSLSPLSGHYRPNTAHFRAFLASLREAGADLSHVSISKSYAVLLGLEAYIRTRQKAKKAVEKLIHPKGGGKADIAATGKKEQQSMRRAENERDANRAAVQMLQKLKVTPQEPAGQKGGGDGEKSAAASAGGVAHRSEESDMKVNGDAVDK